jgi:ABC-2 type transport system permease protein
MTTTTSLPTAWQLGIARGGLELRHFFRHKEQVIFTFTFPAFVLVLLGSIFHGDIPGTGMNGSQVFAASMIGAGIIATSFTGLGIGISVDREDGTLKRLRGTPMPPTAYFVGKIIMVAVSSLAEVVLLFAVGMLLFDLQLPSDPGRWFTFVWVFLLGVTSCSLLGIALSAIARSAQAAPAVLNLPFIALQFVSGVYITPITQLPHWMVDVASFFPVKWVCQGFRSVFLPDSLAFQEAAGTWEHGRIALVLGAWVVIGGVLCLTTFRWTSRRES